MSKTKQGAYIVHSVEAELWHEKNQVQERAYLVVRKPKTPKIGLEVLKKGDKAEIKEMRTPERYQSLMKQTAQQLLFFTLNQLKKEGITDVQIEWSEWMRDAAKGFGFRDQGSMLVLKDIQKKGLELKRKNEKIIARYSKGKKRYEIREQTERIRGQIDNNLIQALRLEDMATGFSVAACEWRKNGKDAWIDAIKTTVENSRMAKTLLIYALWEMKRIKIKNVFLLFGPDKKKEVKAAGLYRSVGFKPLKHGFLWGLDLEKTRLQKMHLK